MLASTVYKPLPLQPRHGKRLRNLFLPLIQPQEPCLVLSPNAKKPSSSVGTLLPTTALPLLPNSSTALCILKVPLNDCSFLERKPVRDPTLLDARLTKITHANKNLQQTNKVLY